MKLSLPVKFALFSFVITLFGVVGVARMAYVESDQLLQEEAINNLFASMGKKLVTIEDNATLIQDDVAFLAQSDAVRAFANAVDQSHEHLAQQDIEQLFFTVLGRREMYYQVRLIGIADQGREVVRVARLKQGLRIIDHALLQQKGGRDYFLRSIQLKPGSYLYSDITFNREHGKITQPPQPMLRVSTAIYNDSGQLRGVLLINADFNVFTASLQHQPDHHSFFVANQAGDYVVHTDQSKAMAFEYHHISRLQDDYKLKKDALKRSYHIGSIRIDEYILDGANEALLLAKLHLDKAHQDGFLTVGAVVALQPLHQKSVDLRDKMLLLTLVLALLLGLVTYWFARYFTRPIQQMIDAAVKIGNGDEDVDIPVNTYDDIGKLGQALQQMVVALGKTQHKTDALNVALEMKVSQRTAQLARLAGTLEAQNSELERAVVNAEAAAVAKGQFLATMSHEIRTPLNGILGLTELVLADKMLPKQRRRIEIVYESGQALLTILNDILDVAKLDAGQMEIKKREFNPNKVIEGVSQLFATQTSADEVSLELIIRGVSVLPTLFLGDSDRLHQVMMNLLSNALKFTEQGEVVLSVEILSESDDGAVVHFEVCDTGRGISDADQARLFEEFTQADGTDSRKHGGTGLGLAIVKKLVALMGGEIQVESELGKGSRFFFDLELEKSANVKDHMQAYRHTFAQWRVLVVDDNATNRAMLDDTLQAWGMHCTTLSHANIALQQLQSMALKEQPYHVILIDQNMQGLDGMSLARLIKEDTNLVDLKVIMTTSLDMMFDQKLRDKYGLDGFIRKPVYMHSLFETILSVMGIKSRQQNHQHIEQVMQRHERILLAEDNAVNQQVALGMLKNQGFEHIDVAKDGVEALEYFTAHAYDLVLMDIQMPELDGLAATREIRSLEQGSDHPPVPVIALTAHALAEDKQRTREAGMNDHLTKPLTGKSLALILDTWLPYCENVAPDSAVEANSVLQTNDDMIETVALEAVVDDAVVDDAVVNEAVVDETVVDEAALRQLRHDMGFGIGMILDTYSDELPKQVDDLIAAIHAGDADRLRRNGHRLKGSSRSIAAYSLGELCFRFEKLGQSGQPEDMLEAMSYVPDLQHLTKQVLEALHEDWLDDIRS